MSGVGAAGQDIPLIEAVKDGDTAAVRALLDKGGDVNASEVDGTTALHWAVHRDHVDVTDLVIRAGANVRAMNRYGVAPLSLACLNGSEAMVAKLLRAGADPETTQPGGETALMTAARTGNADVVRQLLARGADVNATEEWKGQTALMWAAAENNAAAVKALIAGGADIAARSQVSPGVAELGNRGFTAFTFAARAGAIDAAEVLLEAGASVNETLADGTSALVLAVMSARYEMAAFLLDHGADPNAAAQGWTALHQIVWTRRPNRGFNTVFQAPKGRVDSLSLVEKLLAHGADINARATQRAPTTVTGRNRLHIIDSTPLFLAAHRVDVGLIRFLLQSGADPLLPNEDGTTPLMAAAGVGLYNPGENPGTPEESAAAVKLVLEAGGDPATIDANGDTALHGAAYWDSPGAVELLLAANPQLDLDVVNNNGWTPLRVADGVMVEAGTALHFGPAVAAQLRALLKERGLPVPDPVPFDAAQIPPYSDR
jgi:ankyrin repeat protein